jgi:hypothetical protein
MRHGIATVLIVMGSLVILGPITAAAYAKVGNNERIAEFYQRNSYTVRLPEAMDPGFGPYSLACWLAGAGMVVAGALQARSCPPPPTG